ncbi:MAG: hypothetical protein GX128_05360 [Bacteroidales bacterium]|jgi:uncharacterized protein involved in exopolysaccharide biosynthesis|nr:hypothetical protein [Bacteroidales bacterium]
MADPLENSNKFNSGNLILFIYKWRKPLVLTTIIAVICSVIFSSPYFITPKFKSFVILYPTSSGSISKALLTDRTGQQHDLLDFGQEAQTEHMLQILNSGRIRNNVVEKFNLMEHYKINPSAKYKQTRLQREYERNISFRRTEFMAVKISVLDKEPQIAADIANYIAMLVDSVRNEMRKEIAIPGFQIVEQQYLELKHEIKLKEDSLTMLRTLGVHDYESQSEMLNQQLAIEIARNNNQGIKALEERLEVLSKYGSAYVSLRDQILLDQKQLSILKTRYDEAKVDAEQQLPFKFMVEEAIKAEKKSYPIRWLIVLFSAFSTLLIGIITLLVAENFRTVLKGSEKKDDEHHKTISIPIVSKKERLRNIVKTN